MDEVPTLLYIKLITTHGPVESNDLKITWTTPASGDNLYPASICDITGVTYFPKYMITMCDDCYNEFFVDGEK